MTATVTEGNGRFVSGLRKDDFVVYEDGKPQAVSQFDSERVPVSLGIALDTSGSMTGEELGGRLAHRLLFDLLDRQDEIFLYRFDSRPELVQSWTPDRQAVGRRLGAVQARGGTALYDTVAEAVPLAQSGTRRKKALVLITDGNDTSSRTQIQELHQLIRQTEVLVYAIGIDASGEPPSAGHPAPASPPSSPPVPSPFPGKRPAPADPPKPASTPPVAQPAHAPAAVDRVNVNALREITDDSGSRTDVIYSSRDLDPTTAGIADELSNSTSWATSLPCPGIGRWHTIEVRVRKGNYTVRARKALLRIEVTYLP